MRPIFTSLATSLVPPLQLLMSELAHTAMPEVLQLSFRQCGRQLSQNPLDLVLHLTRLDLAKALPGTERLQGVLADLFLGCDVATPETKSAVLKKVGDKLPPLLKRQFEKHMSQSAVCKNSTLATRWSVLVSTTLDVPTRALRCSTDDSLQKARNAVRAWHENDEQAVGEFLEHCVICRDTLAFMFAKRAIFSSLVDMPQRWSDVYQHLINTI